MAPALGDVVGQDAVLDVSTSMAALRGELRAAWGTSAGGKGARTNQFCSRRPWRPYYSKGPVVQWDLPPGVRPGARTQCKPCATCDGPRVFTSRRCTPASDTQCDACTPCAADKYEARPCSAWRDATCLPCGAACPRGEYEYRPCSTDAPRQCEPCGTCPARTFETTPCSAHANTQCEYCRTCPEGEYETKACGPSRPRPSPSSTPFPSTCWRLPWLFGVDLSRRTETRTNSCLTPILPQARAPTPSAHAAAAARAARGWRRTARARRRRCASCAKLARPAARRRGPAKQTANKLRRGSCSAHSEPSSSHAFTLSTSTSSQPRVTLLSLV